MYCVPYFSVGCDIHKKDENESPIRAKAGGK